MSRWKLRVRSHCFYPSWGFYQPEESLLALKISNKGQWFCCPGQELKTDTKCPHKCCYKLHYGSSKMLYFLFNFLNLKCIILNFFLIWMIFSCKGQNKTWAKQLDRSKDTFRVQSLLFTQKCLPQLCFYKRFRELSESQIFWWYLNKLKFRTASCLIHFREPPLLLPCWGKKAKDKDFPTGTP